MKKGKIYILFFLLSILLTACPADDKDLITFYNNSKLNIYSYVSLGGDGIIYPDTALTIEYHGYVESGKFLSSYHTQLYVFLFWMRIR